MKLKIFVTTAAIVLGLLHIAFPDVSVDAVTLVLGVIAILPWLMPLVKSVELPGGFKIELQDVKEATEKVVTGSVGISRGTSTAVAQGKAMTVDEESVEKLKEIAANDSNLAVIGAGLEIEKRLLRLAENRGLSIERSSLSELLRDLQKAQVLQPEVVSGLRDLVALRNRAAHGATVSSEAAAWVLNMLPLVLESIDRSSRPPK